MTKDVRGLCREVDRVTVKGSVKPVRMFTVDLQDEYMDEIKDRMAKLSQTERKRILDREKNMLWQQLSLKQATTMEVFNGDGDFQELRQDTSKTFTKMFAKGYKAYIAGDWTKAHQRFSEIKKVKEDGPTNTLLNVIESHNCEAPSDWQGFRALTSK